MRTEFGNIGNIGYEDSAPIPWPVVLAVLAVVVLTIWLVSKVNRVAAKTIAITLAVLVLASIGSSVALGILAD
jgi:Na+-translocating ferredoxin:NAD+ oxidoreductase RnfE subunit